MSTAVAAEPSEARVGSYWLSRVGAAVVLSGLVVFANYGAGGRLLAPLTALTVMYAVSALALLLGLRLEGSEAERRDHRSALVGGGLAGVYFTTYAAHAVGTVRVVPNGAVALLLLMSAAGLVVWLTTRRQSPDTGVLALLLAFYATLLGPLTPFTLASNAVLAGAAFLFIVRDAWSVPALGLMVATFLSFAWWLLFRDGWLALPLYLGAAEFWRAAGALLLYWLVFATPALLATDSAFTARRRAAFIALDSGFVWALVGLMLPRSEPRAFAVVLFAHGLVLLGLAALLSRRSAAMPSGGEAARTQGIVLLVVATAAAFTGSSAALTLALVAVALAMATQYVASSFLRAVTLIVSLLAAGFGSMDARASAWPAALVAAVLVFIAWWVDRHEEQASRRRLGALFFSAIGFLVWLMVTLYRVPAGERAMVLALEAVALTVAAHLLGLVPAVFLAQAFLVAAHVTFLRRAEAFAGPSWHAFVVLAATLLLSLWWRTRSSAGLLGWTRQAFTIAYAVVFVGVAFVWLRWRIPPESAAGWLAVPAIMAVAGLVYAVLTGEWKVGIAAQTFLVVSVAGFWLRWEEMPPPGPLVMLTPLLALMALAAILDDWRRRLASFEWSMAWVRGVAAVACILATFLLVIWVYWYVPRPAQFLVLEVLAVLALAWAGERREAAGIVSSLVLSTGGLLLFWVTGAGGDGFRWADLVAFVLLLAQQQLWRRRYPELIPAEVHDPAMVMGVFSLWRWAHLVVAQELGYAWQTLGWAAVGFVAVALGIWLREGGYRDVGAVILASALGRMALLYRVEPDTIARLVSVLALGTILLVLGFVYARYRDRFLPRTPAVGPAAADGPGATVSS